MHQAFWTTRCKTDAKWTYMSLLTLRRSTDCKKGFKIAQSAMRQQDAVWSVGQMVLIAGDISNDSMLAAIRMHFIQRTLWAHYKLLQQLRFSLAGIQKRQTFRVCQPRGPRWVCLEAPPDKAIDVNCCSHYKAHENEFESTVIHAALSHSWYFLATAMFLRDLYLYFNGGIRP